MRGHARRLAALQLQQRPVPAGLQRARRCPHGLSLLPGGVNETDIPYCQLDCLRDDATPSQSAAAPDCYRRCRVMNQATPENILLVRSRVYGVFNDVAGFTQPPEWQSWYPTQTVLPKTVVRRVLLRQLLVRRLRLRRLLLRLW